MARTKLRSARKSASSKKRRTSSVLKQYQFMSSQAKNRQAIAGHAREILRLGEQAKLSLRPLREMVRWTGTICL
jgi:hypothetical protein